MSTTVADLMSRNVFTVDAHEDLADADELMRLERIRHVPVTEGGKLVGLLTHRDVLRAQTRLMMKVAGASEEETTVLDVTAGSLMTKNVRTTTPDAAAVSAARLLLDNRFGCLPVIDDDGAVVGIVTEVDFLRWALDGLSHD